MSVHLTESARFHAWDAKPEPEVGEPHDETVYKQWADGAYVMNPTSPQEFIICNEEGLAEVEK